MSRSYKILRFFASPDLETKTCHTGLTLEEVQKHCQDKESSSMTCTTSIGRARTRKMGPWLDGYTAE